VKKQDLRVLVRFLCCRADFPSSNTVYYLSCQNESFRVASFDEIFCEIAVLNAVSEELVRRSINASPL